MSYKEVWGVNIVVPNIHPYNFTLTNIPSSMHLLGVYLGDIYLLHVAIFAHLPKKAAWGQNSLLVIFLGRRQCKNDSWQHISSSWSGNHSNVFHFNERKNIYPSMCKNEHHFFRIFTFCIFLCQVQFLGRMMGVLKSLGEDDLWFYHLFVSYW